MESIKVHEGQEIPANSGGGVSQSRHNHCGSGKKHMLLMVLCCLAPIGLIWALNQTGYTGNLNYLALFLCPLMHLFMMRGINRRNRESDSVDK